MRSYLSLSPRGILPSLLLGLVLTVPALAAKPPEKAPAETDPLVALLGPANNHYIADDSLISNPDQGGRYDYRNVTILPEFERFSAKGRWTNNSASTLLKSLQNFDGTRGSSALRQIWRQLLLSDFNGLTMDGKIGRAHV